MPHILEPVIGDADADALKPNVHLFDGPARYTRHCALALFTNTKTQGKGKNERLYSAWKLNMVGVKSHFQDVLIPWDRNYPNARKYFQGPESVTVRTPIQASHHRLYARNTYADSGLLQTGEDFMRLLRTEVAESATTTISNPLDPFAKRIKPAVYTYLISAEDDSFRFAEAGAAFRSTHALHACCAEEVRYAGEFHPRPKLKGGWDAFSDDVADEDVDWELVVDNHSGTYAPDEAFLPNMKALLEENFPGLNVVLYTYGDDEATRSREGCRAYALRCRGVTEGELRLPKAMTIHPTLEGEEEM